MFQPPIYGQQVVQSAQACVGVMSPVNVFMIVLQRGCDLSGIPLYSMNNGTSGFSSLQLTDAHARWQYHVQGQIKRLKSLKL